MCKRCFLQKTKTKKRWTEHKLFIILVLVTILFFYSKDVFCNKYIYDYMYILCLYYVPVNYLISYLCYDILWAVTESASSWYGLDVVEYSFSTG